MEDEKIKNAINAFVKNLKFERTMRKLSQKDVAREIGITPQSYQAYESGLTLPTTENLLKITMLFDVSLDDLFEL